jgi:hypothetical protein
MRSADFSSRPIDWFADPDLTTDKQAFKMYHGQHSCYLKIHVGQLFEGFSILGFLCRIG